MITAVALQLKARYHAYTLLHTEGEGARHRRALPGRLINPLPSYPELHRQRPCVKSQVVMRVAGCVWIAAVFGGGGKRADYRGHSF